MITELVARTGIPARTSTTSSSASATPTARPRRSAAWPPSTPGSPSTCPACRSTGAAGPACRRSSTRRCRCRPARSDLVLAGGAESMSQAEFYATGIRWGVEGEAPPCTTAWPAAGSPPAASNHPVPGGMLETAENLRRRVRHHPRASRTSSPCARTSAPSRPRRRAGSPTRSSRSPYAAARARRVVDTDEHPRPDASMETLARAAPRAAARRPRGDRHRRQRQRPERRRRRVHRDHPERAAELGLRPLGRLVSWAVAGVAPEHDGHRPGPRHRQGAGASRTRSSRTST